MPYALPAHAVNALFFVRRERPWLERLRDGLADVAGATQPEAAAHAGLLERRLRGELDWRALIGAGLPGEAVRVFSAMLLPGSETVELPRGQGTRRLPGTRLPLYTFEGLVWTLDLYNPGDEGGDPAYDPTFEIVELLVHRDYLYPQGAFPDGTPVRPDSLDDHRRRADYGGAFGRLACRLAEALAPHFAFSEGYGYHRAWFVRALDPRSVAHAAAPGARYWDYLWPLSYWSPELLGARPGLEARLNALSLTGKDLERLDPFVRLGVGPTSRRLSTGGLFVQYRFVLGAEHRGDRARVDTKLARQARLKTINLTYGR